MDRPVPSLRRLARAAERLGSGVEQVREDAPALEPSIGFGHLPIPAFVALRDGETLRLRPPPVTFDGTPASALLTSGGGSGDQSSGRTKCDPG